jgi:hypothetical protein
MSLRSSRTAPLENRERLALLAMWAAVALFELTKAVHIDDTAYLEIARAILANPWHPMSGLVNWGDTAAAIHAVNQPHLLFYLMAAVMKVAPAHLELALHVVWWLFSGLTIALFHRLARELDLPRPLTWTAIFCLGPAFIPSQNLMVDVPLVGLWLAFFYTLIAFDGWGSLLAAAVLVATACLVKYPSLILVPILGLVIARSRRPRALTLLLIPFGALAAWSLFNWWDYGGIHILERPIATGAVPGLLRRLGVIGARAGLWLVALGAVSPFAPVFLGPLTRSRGGRTLVRATVAIAVAASAIGRLALHGEPVVQSVLRGLFFANGLLVAALTARALADATQRRAPETGRPPPNWLLAVWAVGAALFIVVLSPFIAVRHVLLALPAVLLLIARGPDALDLSPRGWALISGVTALLGVALGASDARLAEVYRREAPELAARFCHGGARCVAVGHWGWQWYAEQAGFEIYDRARTNLRPGDRVFISNLVGQEPLAPSDAARLRPLAQIEIPATAATWVRSIATEKSGAQGNRSGGFYYFWTSVPWTITGRPLDGFAIYEVATR